MLNAASENAQDSRIVSRLLLLRYRQSFNKKEIEEIKSLITSQNVNKLFNGKTPLHYALESKLPFLHHAAIHGDVDVMLTLIERGADYTIKNNKGHDAIQTLHANKHWRAFFTIIDSIKYGKNLSYAGYQSGLWHQVGDIREKAEVNFQHPSLRRRKI